MNTEDNIFIPDELREFLVKEAILEKYIKAFKDDSDFRDNMNSSCFFESADPMTWISGAFHWGTEIVPTPRSWSDISFRWREFLSGERV